MKEFVIITLRGFLRVVEVVIVGSNYNNKVTIIIPSRRGVFIRRAGGQVLTLAVGPFTLV